MWVLPLPVVVAIVFGIIVDDTIHFLSEYLKARREGLSAEEAVRSSFHVVGQAVADDDCGPGGRAS